MQLLDGRTLAAKIREEVKEEIEKTGIKPGLAVVLVGADPASHLYVSLKERACAEVGIKFEKHLFFAAEPEEKIIARIRELNARPEIHAILVQLPLPHPLDDDRVISAIDPRKDVDGFHPENLKLLAEGRPRIIPVVHRGILALIDLTGLDLRGTSALIFANSHIFANPLSTLLTAREMRVKIQIPNRDQPIPSPLSPIPFIIVSALGRPHWLSCAQIPDSAIVIDVGTTHLEDGTLVGDIDASICAEKPGFLTPVPGGVGPMTVAMLLQNTLDLAKRA